MAPGMGLARRRVLGCDEHRPLGVCREGVGDAAEETAAAHALGAGYSLASRRFRRPDGMSPDTEPRLVDDAAEHRYELWVGDERAGVIEYGIRPGVVELIHTEIDPAFEGRGLGTRLIAGALDDIRARGLELIPTCPFVRAYLRRHPEQRDLVVRPSDRRG